MTFGQPTARGRRLVESRGLCLLTTAPHLTTDATEDRGGRGSEARVGARLRRMLVSDPSRKSFLELVHTPVEDRGPQDESHASQRRSASKFPLWSDKAREGTSKKPGTSEGVGVKRAQLSGGQRTQVASALRDRFQETH